MMKEVRTMLILEVGCGDNRSPIATVAIDVKRRSACDIVADAHFIPFKENIFDTVISLEVLEHLHAPSKGLMEIRRVLKKGGKLVISVPNITEWRRILSINRHPTIINRRETGHRQAWDAIAFHHLADLTGLRIVGVEWFDHVSRINRRERYKFLNPVLQRLLPSSLYYTHMKVTCIKT
jgi:SAM-dependent methyltransferase